MTRKRYVKLMMARGVSRNTANAKAKCVAAQKISYSEAYYSTVKYSLDALSDAIGKTYEAMQRVATAFGVAIRAFVDAFNDAINQ